jgi:molybdopterin/thiamine biosynthesis adenylyltransferase
MPSANDTYAEAFSRNIGILTLEEQEILKNTTVAIAGLGGVGGIHATTLARLGVGGFHLADFDEFAIVNINRQAGAYVSTKGKRKVEVIAAMLRDINPDVRVSMFPKGIVDESIDDFLRGVNVVIDGIDFFGVAPRRLLARKTREAGLPLFLAAPVAFGGSMIIFDPKGMIYDEYFDFRDGLPEEDLVMRFGLGITPSLLQRSYFKMTSLKFKEHYAPSLASGTLLAANLASSAIAKFVLGRGKIRYAPHSVHVDPYIEVYTKGMDAVGQ